MTFIENILSLTNQLLTFYIPTFYTFKFLMNNNKQKVRTVLKFWCVLSIFHLVAWLLSQIIAKQIYPLIDIVILVGLNWKQFEYAEMIYDQFIGPLYTKNKKQIQQFTANLQKIFNKKTQSIKSKVSESTGEKFKGIIGQILVGALNPSNKKQIRQEKQDKQAQEDNSDKDQ